MSVQDNIDVIVNADDTFAPRKRKPPVRRPLSKEHITQLLGFRELIASGYYNSEAVIDDLSESLTKAVCVYV